MREPDVIPIHRLLTLSAVAATSVSGSAIASERAEDTQENTHADEHVADAAERPDLLAERVVGVLLLDLRVPARVLSSDNKEGEIVSRRPCGR